MSPEPVVGSENQVSYAHLQLFVDKLEDVQVYKTLEHRLNAFEASLEKAAREEKQQLSLQQKQDLWKQTRERGESEETSSSSSSSFVPHGRDLVRQLLVGLGFRVTGASRSQDSQGRVLKSLLITSPDPKGLQLILTSIEEQPQTSHANSDNQDLNDMHTEKETKMDDDVTNLLLCLQDLKIDDTTTLSASKSSIKCIIPQNDLATSLHRFMKAHHGRQGIGVLAFYVQNVTTVWQRYQAHHPHLILNTYYSDKDGERALFALEVCAYCARENSSHGDRQEPDPGTILRFIEKPSSATQEEEASSFSWRILGLTPIPATFASTAVVASSSCSTAVLLPPQPAYCDHWVSNVWSRTDFLDILHDTLGFTPKVDFNAGVVAAGEAQIESTVTGNHSGVIETTTTATTSPPPNHEAATSPVASQTNSPLSFKERVALQDQSQVYLPINNAMSTVGHVHGFLKELGQGIHHVASRVENLVEFVQRANDLRNMTGEGFSFLNIPRSYYGVLTFDELLIKDVDGGGNQANDDSGDAKTGGVLGPSCARAILETLEASSIIGKDGAVDLDVSRSEIDSILQQKLAGAEKEEYQTHRDWVLDTILQSRYKNLHRLLQHANLTEETYLGIVRYQVLVDIQGEDLLYQIFTANILQRNPGDEAPFLEFIQRVCSVSTKPSDSKGGTTESQKKIRPGCGGFGIRNFLMLFMSIEVSKAMQEVADARIAGDVQHEAYAQSMVDCFTDQLNESNPILTAISNAMTEEGICKENLQNLGANAVTATQWKARMEEATRKKSEGNEKLMECSARYNQLMKSLRETRAKAT